MSDLIKKLLYAGIGAVALTKEKAEEIIDELVKKGDIAKEEKASVLSNILKAADKRKGEIQKFIKDEIQKGLKVLDVPTREEFDQLKKKVEKHTHQA